MLKSLKCWALRFFSVYENHFLTIKRKVKQRSKNWCHFLKINAEIYPVEVKKDMLRESYKPIVIVLPGNTLLFNIPSFFDSQKISSL